MPAGSHRLRSSHVSMSLLSSAALESFPAACQTFCKRDGKRTSSGPAKQSSQQLVRIRATTPFLAHRETALSESGNTSLKLGSRRHLTTMTSTASFRKMVPADVPDMIQLAISTGMFPAGAETTQFLESAAQTWFDGGPGDWIVEDDGNAVVAVAFYEPRPATDGVWALTMIAVSPALQGTGRGTALLQHVERVLQKEGQRILLIETSSTPKYERTRRFYTKLAYDAVAQVPHYFADDDHMVLFWKDLRR